MSTTNHKQSSVSITRKCAKCGGSVYLTRNTESIPHPNPPADNPNLTITVQGLGTWHCSNGCSPRRVQVRVFTGAGKEEERIAKGQDYVIRDEYFTMCERHRPIAVLTSTNHNAKAHHA